MLTTEYFIQLPHTKQKNMFSEETKYETKMTARSKTRSKHIKGSTERYLLGQKRTQNQSCVFVLINSVLLNLLCVWIML